MPPVPKRSSERRRRNKVSGQETLEMGGTVAIPRSPRHLHAAARGWFNSLRASGESEFFEPSDWRAALIVAMKLSAHLAVDSFAMRLLLLAQRLEQGNYVAGDIAAELRELSLNTPRGTAAEFTAIWSAMQDLLTTESARRRARIEVERGLIETEEKPKAIDEYRKALKA